MAKASPRPDFGKGGRLTFRSDEQGAQVDLTAGQFIRAKVTVTGPGQPVFTLACQHRPLRSAPDFAGHPLKVYEWRPLTKIADTDSPSDSYALTLSFVGGITSYTILMEKVAANGTVITTLKDFDAASTVATDVFHTGITLNVS